MLSVECEWGPNPKPKHKEWKKRLHFIKDYYLLEEKTEEKRKGFWVKGVESSNWESASFGLGLGLSIFELRLGLLSLLVLGQIERPLSNARISHSLVSLFFWFFVHYLRFKNLIFSPISLFQSSFFNFRNVLNTCIRSFHWGDQSFL